MLTLPAMSPERAIPLLRSAVVCRCMQAVVWVPVGVASPAAVCGLGEAARMAVAATADAAAEEGATSLSQGAVCS
jgi:hypothetical protein